METTLRRLYAALGPVAGGVLLDSLDVATFGPVGLSAGWIVGLLAGWWMAGFYGFSYRGKAAFALLAAVYLALPLTEVLPLATIISAVARYRNETDNWDPPAA